MSQEEPHCKERSKTSISSILGNVNWIGSYGKSVWGMPFTLLLRRQNCASLPIYYTIK